MACSYKRSSNSLPNIQSGSNRSAYPSSADKFPGDTKCTPACRLHGDHGNSSGSSSSSSDSDSDGEAEPHSQPQPHSIPNQSRGINELAGTENLCRKHQKREYLRLKLAQKRDWRDQKRCDKRDRRDQRRSDKWARRDQKRSDRHLRKDLRHRGGSEGFCPIGLLTRLPVISMVVNQLRLRSAALSDRAVAAKPDPVSLHPSPQQPQPYRESPSATMPSPTKDDHFSKGPPPSFPESHIYNNIIEEVLNNTSNGSQQPFHSADPYQQMALFHQQAYLAPGGLTRSIDNPVASLSPDILAGAAAMEALRSSTERGSGPGDRKFKIQLMSGAISEAFVLLAHQPPPYPGLDPDEQQRKVVHLAARAAAQLADLPESYK
ncbi:hypothetical protein H4R33_002343 [Dimargaris cristalligena]|uniref:Uncharacterized protein n=1 Tax=Dimargaris cristalligena TaxID=215637 RepID=A0A4P9ZW03_9FUNG|nr:hypothetical protein H4R33_002343 [Dimargaris cristalligena]RKP37805.1 hypothetical protein BJ085DRAFT_32886 [Dimargaris cristalligena]|eukprot:RKP37805.1 hypothetical protein BJ085DRAFT_32886 [Dimargaris cristalligena]